MCEWFFVECGSSKIPTIILKAITTVTLWVVSTLQWRHSRCDGVSNRQPHDCLLNYLFKRRSKKTPKPCVTGLCARNSPVTGEFPSQMANNAENVPIWWRHHVIYTKKQATLPMSKCRLPHSRAMWFFADFSSYTIFFSVLSWYSYFFF